MSAQILCYCLWLKERYQRPPRHGYVVLGDGRRVKIPYGSKERDEIVALVSRIYSLRSEADAQTKPAPAPMKCSRCRHNRHCRYRADRLAVA